MDGPAEYRFDARDGRAPSVAVDRPNAKVANVYTFLGARTEWGETGSGIDSADFERQKFVPSKTSAPGRASFTVNARLAEPDAHGDFDDSPYQYHVGWTDDGGVPAALDHRFADRELARVDAVVAASGPDQRGFISQTVGGALPQRVVERYSPGFDWQTDFYQQPARFAFPADTFQQTAQPERFTLDRPVTRKWNAAVFGPALPLMPRPETWAGRLGDNVSVAVQMFTDQGQNRYGNSRTTTARTALHRDGVLVARTDVAGAVRATVPAGKGAFRLETQATRQGVSELSTEVSAAWTFGSDTVAGETAAALPLLAVRFAPELDDRNRTAAGRPFAFPVYVQRNGSAKPGDVRTTVRVSYDDGATWQPVPLVKFGDRWLAAVKHPRDAKFVSLRASAKDRDGNAVEQTIIRAYGLK